MYYQRFKTIEERFWEKVQKSDDCWLWVGSKRGKLGYGSFWWTDELGYIGAHRASWILHSEEDPSGLWVLHKCDNPPCVKPDHLFLGTRQDNMDDMVDKGRSSRGEDKSPLTSDQVIDIRQKYKTGLYFQSDLAREFGVNTTSIEQILKGYSWSHLTGGSDLTQDRKKHIKDVCRYGHPYTADNTYLWKGKRDCRTCRQIRNEKRDRPKPKGRKTKTHCAQGHRWIEKNIYVAPSTGWKSCSICRKEAARRHYQKNKEL